MLRAAILSLLAVAASATPSVSFPFNSQVPPVARVSQAYDFQFSATTFAQSSGSLSYTLSGAPSWLALDSSSRRLSGTPTTNDVGTAIFNITAADSSGSVGMAATIIVTSDPAPTTSANITTALSQSGDMSGPTSLSLYPDASFDIGFANDTFQSSGDLTYYATLADRTPLPAWLSFNADTMSFSGQTPQLTASPQEYQALLIATEFPGFSDAWVTFTIVVSNHLLIFTSCTQTVKITEGTSMNFSTLRSQLILDGKPIADADFQNATATTPTWLSFDPTSLVISGDWPNDTSSASVAITAMDRFGDVANTTIQFISATPSAVFSGQIGTVDATIGGDVSIDLSKIVDQQSGLNVTVDLGTAAQWLTFDESTLTISGQIPSSAPPQVIEGTVHVATANGAKSDTQSFQIDLTDAGSSVSSESAPSSAPATSTSAAAARTATSESSDASNKAKEENSKNTPIIIAIAVICVVLVVILLVLAWFIFKRRKSPNRRGRSESPKVKKADVSRPIYQEDEWRDKEGALERDVERGDGVTGVQTPSYPPILPVPSPLKAAGMIKRVRQSIGSDIGEGEEAVLKSFNRSSDWSFTDTSPNSHTPHQSMRIATEIARRRSRIPEESPARGRRRERSIRYANKRNSIGVPASRRFTGAGHGRTSYGSAPRLSRLPSNLSTSFSSYSTLSTGMLSPALSSHPVPPASSDNDSRFSDAEKHKSVRIVPGSLDEIPLPDLRPLDQKRASYIRNRASSRSPFFSARASRSSSDQHPSVVPTTSGLSIQDVFSTPHSTSGTGEAAAAESSTGREPKRFPGSLRRKRKSGHITARAYSAAPPSEAAPSPFLHRWDSQLRQRLAVEGLASLGLPRRRNTGDSVRSHSDYSDPDFSTITLSSENKTSHETEDNDDDAEAARDAFSGGSSFPSPIPSALIIPRKNPRRIPNTYHVSKPSTSRTRRSTSSARTHHARTPSDRLARDSTGNIIDFLTAGETPTIEELNVAIAVRNSSTVSQRRRSVSVSGSGAGSASASASASLSVPGQGQGSGSGSGPASSSLSGPGARLSSAAEGMSRAVRQQVSAQETGASVLHRGRRTPLSMISNASASNMANAGANANANSGGGVRAVEGSPRLGEGKGKRPISVEGGRWTSLRGRREETPAAGNEAFL